MAEKRVFPGDSTVTAERVVQKLPEPGCVMARVVMLCSAAGVVAAVWALVFG